MPRGECPTRPVMLLSGRRVSNGPTDCLYALPWRVVVNAEARSCLAACHFFGFGFTHVARQLQATRPTPKVYFCVPPLHIRARGQRPSCSVIFYAKSSYITAIQHRGQIRSWVVLGELPVTKKTEQPGRFSAFGVNTPVKSTPAAGYASGGHNRTPATVTLYIGPFSLFRFSFFLPPLLSRRILWVGQAATALTAIYRPTKSHSRRNTDCTNGHIPTHKKPFKTQQSCGMPE
jgi:hypothetical protein